MKLPSPGLLGIGLLLSELLLAFTKRAGGGSSAKDANSLRLLWLVILGSIILGFIVVRSCPAATFPHRRAFAIAGLVLFAIGIVLRWWSIVQLGRFFTVNVAIAADHRLVESGPYRYLRHPSYTGALLAFSGFAFSMGNWAAFLVMTAPIFLAFVHRMNVEERALIGGLGERYVDYTRRAKRLLPFIY